jgi:hypothetical protein
MQIKGTFKKNLGFLLNAMHKQLGCLTLNIKNDTVICFRLCILLLLSFSLITQFDPVWAAHDPEITITHDIKITFGGLVIINDIVSIHNTGTTPLNHFQIGFPNTLSEYFEVVTAQSADFTPLSITLKGLDANTNIYWLDILFSQNVEIGDNYNFTVTYAFSQLITYNSTNLENQVTFPEYPAVTSNVTSCESSLRFAEGTVFANSSWGNSTSTIRSPLQANYNLTGWAIYTGSQRVIECPFAVRNIVLDSWGNSLFYDTYHIRNTGHEVLYFFDFPLPPDANGVTAYDDFGSLSVFIPESGDSTVARVTFRYPLHGDEGTTSTQDAYTVTIHYQQPTQDQLIETSPLSALSLDLQVLSSQNFIINKQTIHVTLPEGAHYLQATPTPINTSNLLTPSISYITQKVAPFTPFLLSFQYDFNIFWAAFHPTLWLSVVILGFAAVIYIRKQKQILTTAIPDPNISIVQSLVEACGERTGLWNQIETLENDFDTRRIRRKDFNRRRRILIQRLSTMTNEISTLSKRVSALGTPYQEQITRLTQAETEYQATRTEITRLRTQLRRGQLSSNAYKQEKSDRDKTLQRIKATIDDIVFDLNKIIS